MDGRTKLMLIGLVLNSLFLFIRYALLPSSYIHPTHPVLSFHSAIYRTIELHSGWDGKIIANQALFNWLDGAMITLATYTFNILHPGWLLFRRGEVVERDEEVGKENGKEGMGKANREETVVKEVGNSEDAL
jgi:hypothetical protein